MPFSEDICTCFYNSRTQGDNEREENEYLPLSQNREEEDEEEERNTAMALYTLLEGIPRFVIYSTLILICSSSSNLY